MSRSDLYNIAIIRYLEKFRGYYPGILEWYAGLNDGFASGRRRMFVSWNGSKVNGLAITKTGRRAKLCHISVCPSARDRGVGSSLVRLALRDLVLSGANEIRVTTGEEVFREHASFFRSFGFEAIDWHVNRYRRGVSELLWSMKVDRHSWHVNDNSFTEKEGTFLTRLT